MLPSWYSTYQKRINKAITSYLDSYFLEYKNTKGLGTFKEAIYYGVQGGKRIRSILALEFYLTFSEKTIEDIKDNDDVLKYCISIEFLHSYSLIHDDLPSIDNDTLRRGQPTVWKKYDVPTAILVGDLLNSLAFEILSSLNPNIIAPLLAHLGKSAGFYGMVGGQVLDIFYEGKTNELSLELLIETHNKKTGAMLIYTVYGAIIMTEKSDINIAKYKDFAKKLGLAFQVKDDLLDFEGTQEQTGKSVGGENKGFVFFMGLEKTKKYLDTLYYDCLEIIQPMRSEKLEFIVKHIVTRKG